MTKPFDPTYIHTEERIAGKRAPFHVYHRNPRGKLTLDIAYTDTEAQAAAFVQKHCPRDTIVRIIRTEGPLPQPTFALENTGADHFRLVTRH